MVAVAAAVVVVVVVPVSPSFTLIQVFDYATAVLTAFFIMFLLCQPIR